MAGMIADLIRAEADFIGFALDRVTPHSGDSHVRFVQIGANESDNAGDPIHQFITAGRWKGLLVEPLPHVFEILKTKLRPIAGLQFAAAAVGAEPGTLTLYYPENRTSLASFNPDIVLKHFADPKPQLSQVEVRVETVSALVAEADMDRVDVLVVDTEGMDGQILQSVDFSALTPSHIVFETAHLDATTLEATVKHLSVNDYICVIMGANAIALKSGHADSSLFLMMQRVFTHFRTLEQRSKMSFQALYDLSNSIKSMTPIA